MSTGIKHEFNADDNTNDTGPVAISKQICCQSVIILRILCSLNVYIYAFKNLQQYSCSNVVNTIMKELSNEGVN